MSGALNTQADEFPQDPNIFGTGTTNADEFRDIDLTDTAVHERRVYANGPDAYSEARVSDAGARRYSSFVMVIPPGSAGYPGDPVLLLGEDPSRTRIVISHGDTSYIILGPREQVATGAGLRLSMDLLFETTAQQSVYAAAPADAVNAITVSVWAEYA